MGKVRQGRERCLERVVMSRFSWWATGDQSYWGPFEEPWGTCLRNIPSKGKVR